MPVKKNTDENKPKEAKANAKGGNKGKAKKDEPKPVKGEKSPN
jgi:hypothetical protein